MKVNTYSVQARVGTAHLPPIAPCRARFCHQNTTADKFGTKVHAGVVGGGASRDPRYKQVDCLASRDHRPDERKLLCSAHIP